MRAIEFIIKQIVRAEMAAEKLGAKDAFKKILVVLIFFIDITWFLAFALILWVTLSGGFIAIRLG